MTLKEDEYLNEADGLIYCSKCHTPRQCRVQLGGKRIPFRPYGAAVSRNAYEQQEKRTETAGIPGAYLTAQSQRPAGQSAAGYNFSNNKGYNPEIRKAHEYVAHWKEMKEKSLGLLLWGDVGTGKSFFAGGIAKRTVGTGRAGSDDQFCPHPEHLDRDVLR